MMAATRAVHTTKIKLAGSAKALSCRTDDDKYKRVSHLYFLTDYAYFFESSTDKNEFFYSDSRIDKFE